MKRIKPLFHPLLTGFVLIIRVVTSSWESSLCPERLPVLWHSQSANRRIKLWSYFEDQQLFLLKYPHCTTLELVHLNPLIDGCWLRVHMNGMWGLVSDVWVFYEEMAANVSVDQDDACLELWLKSSLLTCLLVPTPSCYSAVSAEMYGLI